MRRREVRSDYRPLGWSSPFDSLDRMLEANYRIKTRLNRDAELSGELPYNPLQWDVISSTLNPADHTLATISGNEKAVAHARHHASPEYPAGSVLAIITWSQSDPSSSSKCKALSI